MIREFFLVTIRQKQEIGVPNLNLQELSIPIIISSSSLNMDFSVKQI